MWSSPLMAAAMAHPAAWGNWVARLPEIEKMLPFAQWYMTGIWRPLHMSFVFERHWHIRSVRLRPRTTYRPWLTVGRKEHVTGTQSHALRNRNRFLAGGLHIERDASLALHALHPVIE